MMISSRGRYALRAMLDMAEHGGGEWLRLSDIAQRQQLSKKYLESIMASLSRAKLVESAVGKAEKPDSHISPRKFVPLLKLRQKPVGSCNGT